MKTYLDCIPCFMDQALRAGRISGMEETDIKISERRSWNLSS